MSDSVKTCKRCLVEKDLLTEFYPAPENLDGRKGTCRECHNQRRKEKRLANPEAYNKKRRKYNKANAASNRAKYLKREFGISLKQYDEMFTEQGGVCAICKEKEIVGRSLSVDHCHVFGHIRGLLCRNCNLGLGHFLDNPQYLIKALAYVGWFGSEIGEARTRSDSMDCASGICET